MDRPKIGRAIIAFWLMSLVYLGMLFWVDRDKGLMDGLSRLYRLLPLLMCFSLASYLARYLRWYWLLARAGTAIRPIWGFVAYLSGFAFTATPGKVGELLRIRYFQPMGAPPYMVFSAFVYERVFDLLVVLGFACLAAGQLGLLPVAAAFVALVLATVMLLAAFPNRLIELSCRLERRNRC
jgi:hypothetical protein